MGKRNPAQVTLKDIALETGYTINTVSHALKNKPDIGKETRERIQRVAEEMGYIGNALAESMRTGFTRTVALILGDISNPHLALIACEAERTMRSAGYNTILYNTEESPDLELHAIRSAVGQKVDGILICPTQQGHSISYLKQCGIPFVLLGRNFEDDPLPGAAVDDEQGGYLATRELLEHGHRRILLLEGPPSISSARLRRRGYERALAEYGITPRPEWICPITLTAGSCTAQLRTRILYGLDCTAIFAFSDMVALEAIAELNRHGLSVPDDISIVGFDHIQGQFPLPTPLTTVCATESMATAAANQLLQLFQGNPQTPMICPVRLIRQNSVRSL